MGIDVYLRWEGQTKEDEEAQYTGFSVEAGNVGYLREAYHGGPYATKVLVPECWGDDGPEVTIPAEVLRERLPRVLEAAKERNQKLYNGEREEKVLKSFEDFVALAELAEAETGKPCRVLASY